MSGEPEPQEETKRTLRGRYSDLKERYQELVTQFGLIAFITHFSIGLLTFVSFAVLIEMGVEVEGAAGGSGVLASAWVAYKVTMPVRLMITVALTPIVAAAWYRLRGSKPEPVPVPATDVDAPQPADS